MGDWQPIETAWRAGGQRIIVTDGLSVHGAAWFHPRELAWLDCDGITPTHWMPLPQPPASHPKPEPVETQHEASRSPALPWETVGELCDWIESVRTRAFINGMRHRDISLVEATQIMVKLATDTQPVAGGGE